jgi:tetratricopeptide (TPR) repeat protein
MSPEIKTEIPGEVGEAESEGPGRLIAVAVVLATLAAALTGYLQASALRTHDEADVRAEQLAALSVNVAAGNQDQAQVQVDRYRLLQTEQLQQATASAFYQFAGQRSAALEAARWRGVAKSTSADTKSIARTQHLLIACPAIGREECFGQALPVICSPSIDPAGCGTQNGQGGWYSDEEDPTFPNRYLQAAQWESYRLFALRDAANEQANAAESRFVHLAAGLTMFAVSVFLFAYSLTPQGRRHRPLFAGFATAFLVVGGVWTLDQALQGFERAPDKAAAEFANGEVALHDSRYDSAIVNLRRAIQLRPKFVVAYADLAQASESLGVPAADMTAGPVTVPTISAIKLAIGYDRKAIANGSLSPNVLFDLGVMLLDEGLLTHDDTAVRESRAASHDAYVRFSDQLAAGRHPGAFLWQAEFNTAEADLVLGAASARDEYRRAEHDLVKQGSTSSVDYIASPLTDLHLIAQTRPRLATEALALEDELVATPSSNRSDLLWSTPPDDILARPSLGDVVHLTGIEVHADPGHMQFTIDHASGLDTRRDLVSVQWQYEDPVNGEWAVLPEISGPLPTHGLRRTYAPEWTSTNPGYVLPTFPHTCLPSGRYKVDIYVNARLVGESAPTPATWSGLEATRFPAGSMAFCKPSAWERPKPASSGQQFLGTFESPNRTAGAAIAVFPEQAIGDLSPRDLMSLVVKGFARSHEFFEVRHGAVYRSSYFLNLKNSLEQVWAYRSGSAARLMISAVATSPAHQLYVGLVYGADAAHLQLLNDIMLSYTQV